MTRFMIPIDRATFRKNPNAGQQESRILGVTKTEIVTKDKSGNEFRYIACGDVNFSDNTASGEFRCVSGENAGLILGKKFSFSGQIDGEFVVSVESGRDVQTVYHMPLPNWTFKYDMSLPVCCEFCEKTFPARDLVEDDSGYEAIFSCPFCNESDCCQIEYEKASIVANEIGIS